MHCGADRILVTANNGSSKRQNAYTRHHATGWAETDEGDEPSTAVEPSGGFQAIITGLHTTLSLDVSLSESVEDVLFKIARNEVVSRQLLSVIQRQTPQGKFLTF